MAGHLDQPTNNDLPPEAVERQICVQDCQEELGALESEILSAQVKDNFLAYGESVNLRFRSQQPVAEFEEGNQARLRSATGELAPTEVITQFDVNIEDLPSSLDPLFEPLIEAGMSDYDLKDVRVYATTVPNSDFQGAFVTYEAGTIGRGISVFADDNGLVKQTYIDDAGIMVLDGGALADRGEEKFMDVLANETSHHLLNAARNIYIDRRIQNYVGLPVEEVPTIADLETELIDGFSHTDLPPGDFNYDYFNEFISDSASVMTNDAAVDQLVGRVIDIGNQDTYGLSRDFYFHHLAIFSQQGGETQISGSDLQAFVDTENQAATVWNNTEIPEEGAAAIDTYWENAQRYGLDLSFTDNVMKSAQNPDFVTYIKQKYTNVGIAFTQHIADKINALPPSGN